MSGSRSGSILVAAVAPLLIFAVLCFLRTGTCLSQYRWDSDRGPVPEGPACAAEDRVAPWQAIGFAARATVAAISGRPGHTRLSDKPWPQDMARRLRESGAVIAIATVLGAFQIGMRRLLRGGDLLPQRTHSPTALPLPIAAFLVFALVLRSFRPGHPLDWERVPHLWAALVLLLADGAFAQFLRGGRSALVRELREPWARAQGVAGLPTALVAREVTSEVRGAQARGLLLNWLAGLVVVEGVFALDGLGEACADVLVDHRGLDPLALWALLLVGAVVAWGVGGLPLGRWMARVAP